MALLKRIAPGARVAVRLSRRDRELIFNNTFVDGDVAGRIRLARVDGQRVVAHLTLDDLDELVGHVAAAANHAASPELQRKLDRPYERLAGILRSYTDEDPRL